MSLQHIFSEILKVACAVKPSSKNVAVILNDTTMRTIFLSILILASDKLINLQDSQE